MVSESGGRLPALGRVYRPPQSQPHPFPGGEKRFLPTPIAAPVAQRPAVAISKKSKIKTMLQLFLAILLALTNPAHSGTNGSNTNPNQVTAMDSTGGDTGDIPPTPPGN